MRFSHSPHPPAEHAHAMSPPPPHFVKRSCLGHRACHHVRNSCILSYLSRRSCVSGNPRELHGRHPRHRQERRALVEAHLPRRQQRRIARGRPAHHVRLWVAATAERDVFRRYVGRGVKPSPANPVADQLLPDQELFRTSVTTRAPSACFSWHVCLMFRVQGFRFRYCANMPRAT